MYLPKIKIKLPKFTLGDFLSFGNGEPYSGYYYEDYKGQYFSGKEPSNTSVPLVLQDPTEADSEEENFIIQQNVKPKVEDYDKGFFKRYYLKDSRNGKIVETNEKIYNSELEKLFIKGTTIDWVIQKPANDILIEGSLYQGAITRNKLKVQQAEQQLRGIADYITQYDEFVEVESYTEGYSFEELPYKQKLNAIDLLPSNIQKPKKEIPVRPKKAVKPSINKIPVEDPEIIKVKPKPLASNTKTGGGGGRDEKVFNYDENTFDSNQAEQLL